MLDEEFCEFLEYRICEVFKHSVADFSKGFWCDGILLSQPDHHYSPKYVNDKKQVLLTAFIGNDGQDEYELVLKFGRKALSRYARNLDIKECVPAPGEPDWFFMDAEKYKIEIQLY